MIGGAVAVSAIPTSPAHVDLLFDTGTTDGALVLEMAWRNEVRVLRLCQTRLPLNGSSGVDWPANRVPVGPTSHLFPLLEVGVIVQDRFAAERHNDPANEVEKNRQHHRDADHSFEWEHVAPTQRVPEK